MLTIRHLTCERDQRTLFAELSLQVDRGEILKVSGENGCGKTTLLRIMMGLYSSYEGEVDWRADFPPLYLGHHPGVKDSLSVQENLAWLCQLHGMILSREQVEQALAAVSLSGYNEIPCGALSEGQRKKVNLARFFVLDNPCWILDEPFSSLDASGIRTLGERIEEHVSGGGMIVLTSHQALDLPVTELELGTSGFGLVQPGEMEMDR